MNSFCNERPKSFVNVHCTSVSELFNTRYEWEWVERHHQKIRFQFNTFLT